MDQTEKYSYDNLKRNNHEYIEKRNKKRAQWKKNTCDCNRNKFEWCRTKPHTSKEECISALRKLINKAYDKGDKYLTIFEERGETIAGDLHFSTDTIETVINEFRNNGLKHIWWSRCILFPRTIIIFDEYSILHKGYFYVTSFPLIFDV